MASDSTTKKLEFELNEFVASAFPTMTVEVAQSDRWNRTCVTFRWDGFTGLLPEERFHRLARVIPEDFRQSRLRDVVWLELADGETVDAYLNLPRSEDLDNREAGVYRELTAANFFDSLRSKMGGNAEKSCRGGFEETNAVLSARKRSAAEISDAKLLFIRHGVYCDCQVLHTVEPELEELFVGAA